MTTIRELIESLEEAASMYGDDCRIIAAHQPSWPLAEEIGRPTMVPDDDNDIDPDGLLTAEEKADALAAEADAQGEPVCWLPLDGHPTDLSPYAPSSIFGM